MSWEQMRRRCPSSRFVCVGRLPGYRFAIARHSQLRRCGTANILLENGRDVWGIVYDVNDADLRVLDGFEDGYRREKVRVYPMGDGGQAVEVLVYIAGREDQPPLPNLEYKRLLLEGAKYWKLPAAYIAMLESIEAV